MSSSNKLRTYQALSMNRRMNVTSRGGVTTYARSASPDASPPEDDREESAAVKAIRPLYRLSAILGYFPSCFNATTRRLAAASKHVHELDVCNLSQKVILSTSALLLSNNSIRSISGVSAFRGLVTLSLSDNLIDDWRELETELSQLPFLSHLTLAGNPLELMAYYRLRVINICSPSLESLDGLPVNKNEVGIAPKVLSAHQTMMDKVLLQNECRLYEMAWLVRIQAVHRSLFRHMWGPTSADDVDDDLTHQPLINLNKKRNTGGWGGGRAPRVNAGGSYPPEASPLKLSILMASLDNLFPSLTSEAKYRIQKQLENKARANLIPPSNQTDEKGGKGRVTRDKGGVHVHESSASSVTLLTVDISSLPVATRNICVSWGRALGSLASIQAVLLTELSVMLEDATVRRSEQLRALQRRDPFGRLRAEEEEAERRKMEYENDIYNTKEAFRMKAKASAARNTMLETAAASAAASTSNLMLSPPRAISNTASQSSRTPASSLVSKVLTPAVHAQLQEKLNEGGNNTIASVNKASPREGAARKVSPSPFRQKSGLQVNSTDISSPPKPHPLVQTTSPPPSIPQNKLQSSSSSSSPRPLPSSSPSLSVSAAVNDAIKKSEDVLKMATSSSATGPNLVAVNPGAQHQQQSTIKTTMNTSAQVIKAKQTTVSIPGFGGVFSLSSTSDEDSESPKQQKSNSPESESGSPLGKMSVAYSATLEQAFAPTPEGSDISPDLNVLKRGQPLLRQGKPQQILQRSVSSQRKGIVSSARRLSKTTTASYRAKQFRTSNATESEDEETSKSGSGNGSESGEAFFDFAVNKVLRKILSTAPKREEGGGGGANHHQSTAVVPVSVSKLHPSILTSNEIVPNSLTSTSSVRVDLLSPKEQFRALPLSSLISAVENTSSKAATIEDPRIDQLTNMVKDLADKLESLLSKPTTVKQTSQSMPKMVTESVHPSSIAAAQQANPIIGSDLLAELLACQRASVNALLRIEKDLEERRRKEESVNTNAISAAITAVTSAVAATTAEIVAKDKKEVLNAISSPKSASIPDPRAPEVMDVKVPSSSSLSTPPLSPPPVTFPIQSSTSSSPTPPPSSSSSRSALPRVVTLSSTVDDDNRLLIETSMALSESMMMSTLTHLQDDVIQMRQTYPLSLAQGGEGSSLEDQSEVSSSVGGGVLMTSEILAVSGSGDSGGLFLQRSGGSGSNEAGLSLESALRDDDEDDNDDVDIWRDADNRVGKARTTAAGELQSPDDSFIAISDSNVQQRSYGKLLPAQVNSQVNAMQRQPSPSARAESMPRSSSRGSTDSAYIEGSASTMSTRIPRRNSGGVMALTASAAARIASTASSRSNSRNSDRPPSRASSAGRSSGEVEAHKAPWKPR